MQHHSFKMTHLMQTGWSGGPVLANGKHSYSSSKTTKTMHPLGPLSTPNPTKKKNPKLNKTITTTTTEIKCVDLTCARASFIDCHSGTRHALSRTKQGRKNVWFVSLSTVRRILHGTVSTTTRIVKTENAIKIRQDRMGFCVSFWRV